MGKCVMPKRAMTIKCIWILKIMAIGILLLVYYPSYHKYHMLKNDIIIFGYFNLDYTYTN